jgi:HJR/Mrr/RecB family endonuclease
MKHFRKQFEDWLTRVFESIPVNWVIPISIFIAVFVGGIIPSIFDFDRVISVIYVAAGSVLGLMPPLAVLNKLHLLGNRRQLLIRSGSVQGIGKLTFNEFEHLVAALYESLGFLAVVTGGSGDGGIDVQASKGTENIAIQCKHWRTKQVGPRDVRELRGAVTASNVRPILITSGSFTEAARKEGREKNIELIDGIELIQRIDKFVASSAPTCPLCGGGMRPKDGRRGIFWSCIRYPQCIGAMDFDARG